MSLKLRTRGQVLFQRGGGGTDAEHLHKFDKLSSLSSSIDPELVEEDYLRQMERSWYGEIYTRKKWRGKKKVANEEAGNDKSNEVRVRTNEEEN